MNLKTSIMKSLFLLPLFILSSFSARLRNVVCESANYTVVFESDSLVHVKWHNGDGVATCREEVTFDQGLELCK